MPSKTETSPQQVSDSYCKEACKTEKSDHKGDQFKYGDHKGDQSEDGDHKGDRLEDGDHKGDQFEEGDHPQWDGEFSVQKHLASAPLFIEVPLVYWLKTNSEFGDVPSRTETSPQQVSDSKKQAKRKSRITRVINLNMEITRVISLKMEITKVIGLKMEITRVINLKKVIILNGMVIFSVQKHLASAPLFIEVPLVYWLKTIVSLEMCRQGRKLLLNRFLIRIAKKQAKPKSRIARVINLNMEITRVISLKMEITKVIGLKIEITRVISLKKVTTLNGMVRFLCRSI